MWHFQTCANVFLRLSTSLAVAFALFASLGAAQKPQTGNLHLAALKFSGLNLINEKQAAAGTGLRIGDPITISDLAMVAEKMSKTGEFERVAFQYSTRGNELTAIFTVVENRPLVPCFFDNSVWFSREQLDDTLRARVPFYSGVISMTGAMQGQLEDALRDLLKSKGVTAEIAVVPSPGPAGLGNVMLFRAVGLPMPVKTINFPGAAAVAETDVQAAASAAIGQNFSISNVADFSHAVLLPFYRERGYLQASFDLPQWAVMSAPAAGSVPEIAVTLPVKEVRQYFWDKAAWSGNQQLSTEQLDLALAMKHGELANQRKIDDGFRAIRVIYSKVGFLDANVQPSLNLDDSKLFAAYDVRISEGMQYHAGRVIFAGITQKVANDLTEKWQMKPGAVYDATYPDEFISKVATRRLLEMGIKRTKSSVGLRRNIQAATVDVNIVFQ